MRYLIYFQQIEINTFYIPIFSELFSDAVRIHFLFYTFQMVFKARMRHNHNILPNSIQN